MWMGGGGRIGLWGRQRILNFIIILLADASISGYGKRVRRCRRIGLPIAWWLESECGWCGGADYTGDEAVGMVIGGGVG